MKSLNRIKNILDPKKIVINASVFTIISAITSSSALAITISGSFTGSRASYATGTRSYDIGFDGPISFCNASRQCIDVPFFVSSGTGNTIRVGYRNLVRTSFFSLSITKPARLTFGATNGQIITNATTSLNLWALQTSLPSTEVDFTARSISDVGGADFTLTQVPEPLTVLGSGVALGFGALFKKEYSRKQKKVKSLEK
jgi:hypothetical protein